MRASLRCSHDTSTVTVGPLPRRHSLLALQLTVALASCWLHQKLKPLCSPRAGPTGVGKSELAKTLATYYFGSEEAMVRLDMSEFMERHTVSKLIGSPPGAVGCRLRIGLAQVDSLDVGSQSCLSSSLWHDLHMLPMQHVLSGASLQYQGSVLASLAPSSAGYMSEPYL